MKEENSNTESVKTLSDTARLLCHIFHDSSITHRSLILPSLNKDMKDLLEKTKISEYLFGDKLQDKVNTIKAVKKSGQELKNTPTTSKPTIAPKKYLNYRGPPRQQQQVPCVSEEKPNPKSTIQTKTTARPRRPPQKYQRYSRRQDRLFLHPKSDGTWRFILNLKELNKYVNTCHFKLEDLRTAISLMHPGCFMGTIDLKNAYYLISVKKKDRKYLCFLLQDSLFEFTCLPFGLSTAPYVFTKIMKPVIGYLRSLGLLSTIYLDDILCFADTYDKCLHNITVTRNFLENLGFIVNCLQYLGVILNSRQFSISLPCKKVDLIKDKTDTLKTKHTCRIIEFAQLIGLLVSACQGVEYGWLYTKILENHKTTALIKSNGNYKGYLIISQNIEAELDWWYSISPVTHSKIRQFNFVLEIFSDASLTGWGLVCNGVRSHGHWNRNDIKYYINYLELLAAFIGLKTFASENSDCEILLRIDNTTAIAYINRMGGTRFPHLNNLARKLWQWCQKRKIWVYASYISSKENIIADLESRQLNSEIEWELCNIAFKSIVYKLGKPHVDLFATKYNAKCSRYVTLLPDPDAYSTDAFTIQWQGFFFYAFRPFALISKVLQKIKRERAIGIVVVPQWTSQPWYPLFDSLCVSEKIIFKPHHDLLLSPSRNPHPLHKSYSNCRHIIREALDGLSYSSLNTFRSAISLILGPHVGSDERMTGFFRGIFKLRPKKPKYDERWDPSVVLKYLSNLHSNNTLSLELLTKKLVTLLALVTAHRIQTLSLINIDNIDINEDNINIKTPELIKTSAPNRPQPYLIIPFFRENKYICPGTTLLDYLDVTKNIKKECKSLIITLRKPCHAASTSTISRWIKQILCNSGVDINKFTLHSTRHASTSKASERDQH
uniref:SFRICE_006226 n=1 Tax=Spodoptera frugiperda TaxID=7108 RepID=A0A2H1W6Z8_SPOFR